MTWANASESEPQGIVEDVLAEVLAQRAVKGAVSARTELTAPWAIRFPATPRAGFHIVTRGSCYLRVDGHDGPEHLSAGDIVLMAHGSEHLLSSAPRGSGPTFRALLNRPTTIREGGIVQLGGGGAPTGLICGVYHFESDEPHPVLALLPKLIRVRSDESGLDLIGNLGRILMTELARKRAGVNAVVSRLVDVLFVLIVRKWIDEQPEGTGGWLGALRDARIGRVLAQLHRAPAEPWTIAELAQAAAMSPAAFKRRFSELLREPPLTYLTRLRMDTAARMLRKADAPLSEVAAAVGYESEFAFGRAFKRRFGVAPGRYRSSHHDR